MTASPSFAGANEFTSEPTPRPAAARRGQISPPAAANPARQAPTVHTNAPTKPMIARSSQLWFAPPSAEMAEATRPPSSPGVRATALSATRAKAEIMSCLRQMVIRERSLSETPHLGSG